MFITDVAAIVGIKPAALRKYLRATQPDAPRGHRARYEFSLDDAYNLREQYWKSNISDTPLDQDDTSAPGLPIDLLTRPDMRYRFQELRRARNERLNELLREKRMTVPQMSDAVLMATGRIRRELV